MVNLIIHRSGLGFRCRAFALSPALRPRGSGSGAGQRLITAAPRKLFRDKPYTRPAVDVRRITNAAVSGAGIALSGAPEPLRTAPACPLAAAGILVLPARLVT